LRRPDEQNSRATEGGFGAKVPRSATERAADKIAAALYLISRNSKTDEVVVKLTPDENERVIDVVQRWPDLPSGGLAALKGSRSALAPEQSAAYTSPHTGQRPAARSNPGIGQLYPNRPALPRAAVHRGPRPDHQPGLHHLSRR
jgi:hypothetical protein